jgi:hypothetical protein
MSYAVRTCSGCGLRAPQPEMVQRIVEREVSRSRDSVSGETLFGAFIGNKGSQKKLERTILRTGDRTHIRKEKLWFCASCAGSHDKKVSAKAFLSTTFALVVAAPFVLVALGSKENENSLGAGAPTELRSQIENGQSQDYPNETAESSPEPFEEGEYYSEVDAHSAFQVTTPPSFDCDLARLPSEIAVCASNSLSSLDVRLQSDYDSAGNAVPSEILVRFGRKLYSERVSCGDDQGCLTEQYNRSIETIRQLTILSEERLRNTFNSLGTDERLNLQARMKEQGHYKGKLDGVWGAGTMDSLYEAAFVAAEAGRLDSRIFLQSLFEQ